VSSVNDRFSVSDDSVGQFDLGDRAYRRHAAKISRLSYAEVLEALEKAVGPLAPGNDHSDLTKAFMPAERYAARFIEHTWELLYGRPGADAAVDWIHPTAAEKALGTRARRIVSKLLFDRLPRRRGRPPGQPRNEAAYDSTKPHAIDKIVSQAKLVLNRTQRLQLHALKKPSQIADQLLAWKYNVPVTAVQRLARR
jgi:hypothetical protein